MKSILPLFALSAALPPAAASAAQQPVAMSAPGAEAARANQRFVLDLYRQVARGEDGNVFVSPISVAFVLAPLTAGASGRTRQEMARTLGLGGDDATAHAGLGALMRSLERDTANATISIANGLWLNRDFAPRPAFLDIARGAYEAEVGTLDFGGDPEGSAGRINAWASEQTRGRIPEVVAPTMFSSETRLVVTNAVYFLADWARPFPPSTTERFRLAEGGGIDVPMMAQLGGFRHHRGAGFAALDLPYRDQGLVMTVLLPDRADGLAALEQKLTPALLGRTLRALDRADEAEVSVRLPKFELRTSYVLRPALEALGMRRAFTLQAEFDALADRQTRISGVRQLTFLRVDEEGTEAAAVTVSDSIIVTGARRARPIEFHADRPFLLLLRDRESGAILFIGRILRPDQTR